MPWPGSDPTRCDRESILTDLAVGLRPVGPGLLVVDVQVLALLRPELAAVAAAVVGQHPLNGDAVGGEPEHRPAQHASGGPGGLVVVISA